MLMRLLSCLALIVTWAIPVRADHLLEKLPPGVFLIRRIDVPAEQRDAIGRKLGGNISDLTNSLLKVHGRDIRVNVITAADDGSAQAIHAALTKIKPAEFCPRRDLHIVEYVGSDLDGAIARKTSYELGLLPKPKIVKYVVTAELAPVNRADYMTGNLLFNRFLALSKDAGGKVGEEIRQLAAGFEFGSTLALRHPTQGGSGATHKFDPAPTKAEDAGGLIRYSFENLPNREGVPFIKATLEITANDSGLTPLTATPGPGLTAATSHWPAADVKIRALAGRITQGQTTNEAKTAAILNWLTPGKNLKYSGQTGSRWGTLKVLEQKFGHCWDFADCFVTFCRAAGVPARQVAGWLYGSSGHVWAEYYRKGHGWQQVDPTGGTILPCGIYHIAYFTSEDGEMPIVYLSMPKIDAKPNVD